MTVKERIKEFVKIKGLSERAFCLSVGVGGSYISTLRVSIAPDKLDRIAQVYPDLNLTWLMTGHGEMLNDEKSGNEPIKTEVFNPYSYESKLHERELSNNVIDQQQKLIDSQAGLIGVLERENHKLREEIAELQRQLHGPEQRSKAC
jgi:transcriptional regulator with XRE-family HTH domain